MDEWLTLQFDGGSRGNPGPAGIGVVVQAADGTPLVTLGRYIGRATNNVAEYKALITALGEGEGTGAQADRHPRRQRADHQADARRIPRQDTPDMRELYDEAQDLVREFDDAKIEHNLRHKNELADKLANLAMDRRVDVTDVNGAAAAGPSRGGGVHHRQPEVPRPPRRRSTNRRPSRRSRRPLRLRPVRVRDPR